MRPLTTPARPPSAIPASLRAGALAAIGTWVVVVLPALVGWVAAPESSVGWFSAVSVGSGIWFLGHGQSIGAGGVAVSLTPLLLFAVNVYIAYRWARRLAATQRAAVGAGDWSDTALRGVVPGFLGGYLIMAGVFALLTLGGVAAPGFAAVPGALLVPVVALGFVLLRPDDEESPAFVRTLFRRGPTWLPTVWRVGWLGAGLLIAIGAGVVVLRLVMTFSAVASIQSDYGVNLGGAVIVGIAQLALLGNAVTWALGFVAGPGFSLALGSTVSPAAAAPGLLPLVPVLGAVPEAADYPSILYAVLVLPVAAGVLIGWRVDRELEFFGNLRARLSATVVAGLIAVVVVVAVTALGNGAVGVDRLRGVGVPLLALFLALAAEVLLGALAWLGIAVLRERHKEKRGGSATADSTDGADDTDHTGGTGATDDTDDPAQGAVTTVSARNAAGLEVGGRSGGLGSDDAAGDVAQSRKTDAAVGTLEAVDSGSSEPAGSDEPASESAKTSPESNASAVS
ncbi:hypothetical protein FHX52_2033 [Humibacillus xanthopallidus]|uniref:Uncharacterized protein n=1 Tax=Humibacillus xanthopallidus TaxID=412689 RepID=A0A543PXR5_9MICO|nr:DUF6350 family protein [Humibacillus xanthopallidus]TQN48878.1 hypothetical protein FHX52_2033 [Humibacillus xanthopallidus]